MLKKTINGKTTTFTFDGANQLVSSTTDGVTTKYAYDAAGRLVKEGNKTYRYGYLDKVLSVTEGAKTYTYDYHVDGQLARADYGNGKAEDFGWDGLALIKRGDERFVNEPHVGGGNPVASSKGTTYFNDILGTTVGAKKGAKYSAAALTAFGESFPASQPLNTLTSQQFYTGKPHVAGLGHAFLFRNYRASFGKWQTADPLGYSDGWNLLAYCKNGVISHYDLFGAKAGDIYPSLDEAAKAWAEEFYGRSVSEDKEYGSSFYQNGTGFSYTQPNVGGAHNVSPSMPQPPYEYAGEIHSHGAESEGYNDENFSGVDSMRINTFGHPGYLVTPSGALKKKLPLSPPVTLIKNIRE